MNRALFYSLGVKNIVILASEIREGMGYDEQNLSNKYRLYAADAKVLPYYEG